MTLPETLAQVEAWLHEHAPASAARLAPPVAQDQIDQTERDLGLTLQPDVLDLLRWHNGAGDDDRALTIAPIHNMLSAAAIVRRAAMTREIADRDDDWWWKHQWVPIASDWCGSLLVVDHGNDTPGRVFYWDKDEGESRLSPSWPDLAPVVEELLTALTTGAPMGDLRPVVIAGELDWE